jgi:hypothetical protein
MAFVNERISDEDRKILDPKVFSHPYSKLNVVDNSHYWTIDRKRNIFLIRFPIGFPEAPYYFGFYIDNHLVRIDAYTMMEGDYKNNKGVMTWNIEKIEIPAPLQPKREEVIAALKEAITVRGGFDPGSTGIDKFVINIKKII